MKLLLLASLLAGSVVGGFAYQRDFTGTWQLDVDRSDFGRAAKPVAMTMTITHNGKTMRMTQTTTDATSNTAAEHTLDSECKTDNRFHPVVGADGGSIRCKLDGSAFISEKEWDGGDNQEDIRIKISPDGQTATQQVQTHDKSGVNTMTLLWVRK